MRILRSFLIALLATIALAPNSHAAPGNDPALQAGFHAMYKLDFAASRQHFEDYVRRRPDDPMGYAAQAACVLFAELDRLQVLDAEFYVDDKKLFAEPKATPDSAVKRRLFELTGRARQLAGELKRREPTSEDALFALAFSNGLEADYAFFVEKSIRAAIKPGRAGYENAKRLLQVNPEFHDAYIWTGVTNYVVASLPAPMRWLAKLRGYPGSKETASKNLRMAADRGLLLKPYAKILLVVIHLREKKKTAAQALLSELSLEFPENPLFVKHARRLQTP